MLDASAVVGPAARPSRKIEPRSRNKKPFRVPANSRNRAAGFRQFVQHIGNVDRVRHQKSGIDQAVTGLCGAVRRSQTRRHPPTAGCALSPGYRTLWHSPQTKLDVKQFQQPESNHADANQIDRDHQIQQPRHYQNKNASDQRKDSWNMSGRDVHEFPPRCA